MQPCRERLSRLASAHHHLVDDGVFTGGLASVLGRSFEILCDGGREHLDVTELFRCGLHQELSDFLFLGRDCEGLKHVL